MSPGKALSAGVLARIRDVATKEPELARAELAERFCVSTSAIGSALRGTGRRTKPAHPESGVLFVAECVCGWRVSAGRKAASVARRAHYSQHTDGTRAATRIYRGRS